MADIITTLHPENNKKDNLYPNIKPENIPNKSINRNKLNDSINTLLDNINTLYPSGTGLSTDILSFTNDKGIYVATDNGYWYYWNGTHYVQGLPYNSSVYNENISKYALPVFNNDSNDLINDKYVSYQNGSIYIGTTLKSIRINVSDVETIYYLSTISKPDDRGLAFYNENGEFIIGYQMLSNEQTITVPENAKFCAATINNINDLSIKYNVFKILNKTNILSNNLSSNNLVNNKYIDIYGSIIDSTGLNYVEFIVKGLSKIEYLYTVSSPDYRGLTFYDESFNFISSNRTALAPQIINVPNNAYYCRATVINIDQIKLYTNISLLIDSFSVKGYDILSAYSNILCIGDSLTYSQVYLDDLGNTRQAYNPYPVTLGKKLGINTSYLATAGYTPLNWWNTYNEQLERKSNQLAIIYLGTNNGLTDTLSTDAPEGVSYINWNNTNTGSYAKIIAKCQELGMKIILLKVWTTSGDSLAITNDVIDQLGNRFKCAVCEPINLIDRKYHYVPDYSDYNGVHYNDLGYSAFTNALIEKISLLKENQMKLIIPD